LSHLPRDAPPARGTRRHRLIFRPFSCRGRGRPRFWACLHAALRATPSRGLGRTGSVIAGNDMAEPARKGRPPRHLVAVDGGGSGCRVLVADAAGRVLGRGGGGPANINSDFDGALANILVAAEAAVADAGLTPEMLPAATAVLGLAGAN